MITVTTNGMAGFFGATYLGVHALIAFRWPRRLAKPVRPARPNPAGYDTMRVRPHTTAPMPVRGTDTSRMDLAA